MASTPAASDPRLNSRTRGGVAAEAANPETEIGAAVTGAVSAYAAEAGLTTGEGVNALVAITAAEYTALVEKDDATLYLVTDTPAIYLGEIAFLPAP